MANKPLYKKILNFEKWRELWIAPLIILGVIGLIIPVLPGLLILYIAIVLIDPDRADRIKNYFINVFEGFLKK